MKRLNKTSFRPTACAAFLTCGLWAVSFPAFAGQTAPVPPPSVAPLQSPTNQVTAPPRQPVSLSPDEVKAVEFVLHHKGEAYWNETNASLNAHQLQVLDDLSQTHGNIDLGRYDDALNALSEPTRVLPDDPDVRNLVERLTPVAPYSSRLELIGKAGGIMRSGINLYMAGDTSTGLRRMAYSITLQHTPAHRELFQKLCSITNQTVDVDFDSPMDGVDQKLSGALAAFRNKDYLGSVTQCQEAIQMKPDSALAYKRLGSSFYAMQNFAKAEEAWKKSLKLNPKDPDKNMLLEYIATAKQKRTQQK